MGRSTTGLTTRQAAFAREFLVDLNATQAAIRAGYAPGSADAEGARLLVNVKVAAAVAIAMAERSKRTGVTADRVVRELARIAFADMRSFVEWGPDGVRLLRSAGLSEDDSAAVAELAETITESGGSQRIKLHDKMAALKALMAHLGMNAPLKIDLGEQLRKAAEAEGLDPEEAVLLAMRLLEGAPS